MMAPQILSSFRRKSESSARDSVHKTLLRADALSWIPTFVGMTIVVVLTITLHAHAYAAATSTSAPTTTIASSTSASDTVKNFYTQLTDTMKQGEQLGFAGRYKKLDPIVHQAFNLPLMARFSVGLVWNNATPDEQQQITSAFSGFTIANYASQFTHYNGEAFTVLDEKLTTGGKIVETTLQPKTGDAVALNYLMRQDETGAWRIVDIFINGAISELATRRSEFSAVIKRDGIGALVNSLGEKSKQMGPT